MMTKAVYKLGMSVNGIGLYVALLIKGKAYLGCIISNLVFLVGIKFGVVGG